MKNKEYKVDRSSWPRGPWDTEPEDRIEYRYLEAPCLLVRNTMGSWCGYVGVNSSHPAYMKSYNDVDADVHGGLTYSGKCNAYVCHTPQEGESDEVWWLGFDTAHCNDVMPAYPIFTNGVYRDKYYVMNEVISLANQLFLKDK